MSKESQQKFTPPEIPPQEGFRPPPQRSKPDPFIQSIRAVDAALHLLAPHLTDGLVFEMVERLSTMRPEVCGCLEAIEADANRAPYERQMASQLRLYMDAASAFAQGNACIACHSERCPTTMKIGGVV